MRHFAVLCLVIWLVVVLKKLLYSLRKNWCGLPLQWEGHELVSHVCPLLDADQRLDIYSGSALIQLQCLHKCIKPIPVLLCAWLWGDPFGNNSAFCMCVVNHPQPYLQWVACLQYFPGGCVVKKNFLCKMILCLLKVSGHCYCCLNASMRWRSSSFALWFWNKSQLLNCYGSSFNWGLQTGFTLNDNICGQGILALKVCVDSTSQFGMFSSCVFLLRAHSPQVVENRSNLQGIGNHCLHWQTRVLLLVLSVCLLWWLIYIGCCLLLLGLPDMCMCDATNRMNRQSGL